MSWEEHDLLGDLENERPHEFFYEDFIGKNEDDEEQEYEAPEEEFLSVEDIDFSSLDGKDFKKDFKKINRAVAGKKVVKREQAVRKSPENPVKKVIVPTNRKLIVEGAKAPIKPVSKRPEKSLIKKKPTVQRETKAQTRTAPKRVEVPVKKGTAVIQSRFGKKTTERILVPQDRKVIVEGVDKFILSNTKESEAIKNIGYYKGEKLKELVLIINNNTPNDIEFELFNPSMPLDYLFSTSDNLNNRISVAGDNKVSYSDMLFNMLANPTLLPNAKFVCENPVDANQSYKQFNIPLIFKNKNIAGHEKIHPIQNALNTDIDQNQNNIVYWDIMETLGRAYIPDGMDILSYKVLAGNIVTFGFYYKQVSLKRFFFKEARDKKIL
jgi:hypothetical protein